MSTAGKALICGSIAFDNIMVFGGRFKDHILPDKIHMLNVSFLVPQLRREFGGCAGNVAYNLRLLGDNGYPMATVGRDFAPYEQWMRNTDVPQDYVRIVETEHTAQAFITTDLDDNQITAFHPGAMQQSHLNSVPKNAGITLGIVSPDGRDGMVQHCSQFAAAGIPFIFDPGQGLPMFNGDDLRAMVGQASWVTVNEYEWQMLRQRTGWSSEDVVREVKALIVTRGAQGSTIYTPREEIVVPAAQPQAVVDPTGCGDAYRAGLLHGLLHGLDWAVTGRIASLLGALKVATRGTQNHRFTMAEFAASYRGAFGNELP
jgi:adenosine kinase